MFSLAVATAVGWLLLFVVLLAVPPTSSGDGGGASRRPEVRDEPPAVVGLLARRLGAGPGSRRLWWTWRRVAGSR